MHRSGSRPLGGGEGLAGAERETVSTSPWPVATRARFRARKSLLRAPGSVAHGRWEWLTRRCAVRKGDRDGCDNNLRVEGSRGERRGWACSGWCGMKQRCHAAVARDTADQMVADPKPRSECHRLALSLSVRSTMGARCARVGPGGQNRRSEPAVRTGRQNWRSESAAIRMMLSPRRRRARVSEWRSCWRRTVAAGRSTGSGRHR